MIKNSISQESAWFTESLPIFVIKKHSWQKTVMTILNPRIQPSCRTLKSVCWTVRVDIHLQSCSYWCKILDSGKILIWFEAENFKLYSMFRQAAIYRLSGIEFILTLYRLKLYSTYSAIPNPFMVFTVAMKRRLYNCMSIWYIVYIAYYYQYVCDCCINYVI